MRGHQTREVPEGDSSARIKARLRVCGVHRRTLCSCQKPVRCRLSAVYIIHKRLRPAAAELRAPGRLLSTPHLIDRLDNRATAAPVRACEDMGVVI